MKSLEDKIGQMLLVGFHGLEAPDHILDWLISGKISGVILFARNIDNPRQLATLCKSIHEAAKYPALIAIDQEGGMVARLRERNGFTESPGAMALASAQDSEYQVETLSAILGEELRALGINWNYAPSVDISYNAENPTVGTRSFGNNIEHVSQLSAAAVRGFQSAGIAACAKHFPGLGNTAVDTHLALARLDTDLNTLLASDLQPYRAAIKADLASIMTTHTLFTALDSTYPATLSYRIIQRLIRKELGYEGVITTDCMEMRAISDNYGAGESAILAISAGADIVLMSHTQSMQAEAYDAMLQSVHSGRVPLATIDRANARIEQLKAKYKINPADINIDTISSPAHRKKALEAACAGISMVKQNTDLIPLPEYRKAKIGLIEFTPYADSAVMEGEQGNIFASHLLAARPDVRLVSLHSLKPSMEATLEAQELASKVDILIIATRNAHMVTAQKTIAIDLLQRAENTVLLALRNPYDVKVFPADALLCSCGDTSLSLYAISEVLQGRLLPSGTLPVEID